MSFVFANSEKDHDSDNDFGGLGDPVGGHLAQKSKYLHCDVPRHQK